MLYIGIWNPTGLSLKMQYGKQWEFSEVHKWNNKIHGLMQQNTVIYVSFWKDILIVIDFRILKDAYDVVEFLR